MSGPTDRRRFLRSSLAAGAAMTLTGGTLTPREAPLPGAAGAGAATNPTVRPGLIRWHGDQARAHSAARATGKPVLHFQMMGRLDERFC